MRRKKWHGRWYWVQWQLLTTLRPLLCHVHCMSNWQLLGWKHCRIISEREEGGMQDVGTLVSANADGSMMLNLIIGKYHKPGKQQQVWKSQATNRIQNWYISESTIQKQRIHENWNGCRVALFGERIGLLLLIWEDYCHRSVIRVPDKKYTTIPVFEEIKSRIWY